MIANESQQAVGDVLWPMDDVDGIECNLPWPRSGSFFGFWLWLWLVRIYVPFNGMLYSPSRRTPFYRRLLPCPVYLPRKSPTPGLTVPVLVVILQ